MMPTDENIYGQWPRCGEIDIMEVMGHETNKSYHTIHYGNPHNENQGTKILENGDYVDEYHTFSLEWLPGELIWYVDGVETFRTSDWYSTTEGQGTVAYPAPFDQPFHVILNLAVGGTQITEQHRICIDNINLEKIDGPTGTPAPGVSEPSTDGNMLKNGDF